MSHIAICCCAVILTYIFLVKNCTMTIMPVSQLPVQKLGQCSVGLLIVYCLVVCCCINRVPTVIENPGKINFPGKSWKIDKNSQVMEKLKILDRWKRNKIFKIFQCFKKIIYQQKTLAMFGFSAQISWSLFVDCALYFVWSSAEFINFTFKFVV